MNKERSEEIRVSYGLPENLSQTLAEIFSWTFFLIMLGELAYGETEKKKILGFWGISN